MPADTERKPFPPTENPVHPKDPVGPDKEALEFLFILLVGLIVVGALIASLNYPTSSARAPWIIIVPLLLLCGIQFNRSRKLANFADVRRILTEAIGGNREIVNKVASLIGWMAFLLGAIYLAGHYAGLAVFMLALLRISAKENLRLSIIVTLIVTAAIYGLFEQLFNIELYRGVFF